MDHVLKVASLLGHWHADNYGYNDWTQYRHGFPYFAEYCYYYMAGCMDKALTCITTDDVSDNVKALISEVCTSHQSVCACVVLIIVLFYLGNLE